MIYEFWTDGASSMKINDKRKYEVIAGGWAWALIINNKETTFQSGSEAKATNQRMELTAIYKALQFYKENYLKMGDIIKIYSDSAYCVNIFQSWIKNWKANNWKRKGGKPIENLELIQKIDKLITELEKNFIGILFMHVKAHSTNLWNNYVDQLAVRAKMELIEEETYNVPEISKFDF